jgi:hypothetical protein
MALVARTAVVTADSGVDSQELLAMARAEAESNPHNWWSRELLGAVLLRAGKPEEALRELNEALRMHGKAADQQEGTAWMRLFLCLTHRRLGHADQAKAWREKVNANNWESKLYLKLLSSEMDAAP